MQTKLETITPEAARKYLQANLDNRPLRRAWVEALTGMMKRGQWITTHQGIAFDERGRLVDGQHRLHAICEFGKPVSVLVSRGLQKDAYRAVDDGRIRSMGDRLKLLSDPIANQIACALVRCYLVSVGLCKNRPATDLVDNCFLSMSDDFTAIADRFTKKVPGLTRCDVGSALVSYRAKHEALAEEFLDQYLTGEELKQGDPALSLRNALFMRRIGYGQIRDAYWKTITATKAHEGGRNLTNLMPSTVDWQGNRFERLHAELSKSSKRGAVTKKKRVAVTA